MRSKLFLGLGLLTMFGLAACAGAPDIVVKEDAMDFGDVVNGEVITRDVMVQNIGEADLVVEAVSTSCGCTSAVLEPMTISPGQSGVLHLEFDSGAHGPEENGELLRQIFIASNDPDQPEAVIELRANVIPAP